MRVIFGHDWRQDGVMQAISDFATKVASTARSHEMHDPNLGTRNGEWNDIPRMLNIVPTESNGLSRAAIEAQNDSGGGVKGPIT